MRLVALIAIFLGTGIAQAQLPNTNTWPVFRSEEFRFRISYPPDWVLQKIRGTNIRFSVSPASGPGNCNVYSRHRPELAKFAQTELNKNLNEMSMSLATLAELTGLPEKQIRVISSRRGAVFEAAAIIAVIETDLENLAGKFTRKQMIAFVMVPGTVYTLNCGVSTPHSEDARAIYSKLEPAFTRVFGTFEFLR